MTSVVSDAASAFKTTLHSWLWSPICWCFRELLVFFTSLPSSIAILFSKDNFSASTPSSQESVIISPTASIDTAELAELRLEIKRLRQSVVDLERKVDASRSNDKSAEVAYLSGRVAELFKAQEKFIGLTGNLEENFKYFNSSLSSMPTKSQLEPIGSRLLIMENRLQALNNKPLEDKVMSLELKFTSLESKLEALIEADKVLRVDIAGAASRYKSLEDSITKLREYVGSLSVKSSDEESQISLQVTTIMASVDKKMEDVLATKTKEIYAVISGDKSQYEAYHKETERLIALVTEDMDKLKLKAQELNKKLADTDDLTSSFNSRLTSVDSSLRGLIDDRFQQALGKASAATFDSGTLDAQIANLTLELSALKLTVRELKDQPKPEPQEVNVEGIIKVLEERLQSAISYKISRLQDQRDNAAAAYATTTTCSCTDPVPYPDYAMHSAGGYVVTTRCTKTYNKQAATVYFLGIPLFSMSRSATTAIEPSLNPGECWAFEDFPGHLVISLAKNTRIAAVTLDHILKSQSFDGNITTAPKNFSVYALPTEKTSHDKGELLGNFVYDINSGVSAQTFVLPKPTEAIYRFVELVVHSNHGGTYTCIYRFRVHAHPLNP